MAITRTAWTDDDGSGTTGTILNNAQKTALYDQIDGRWSEYTITLTGSQNNVSITSGGVEADVLYCNNASDLTITSIAAPASPVKPGKRLAIIAVGAGNVYINDQTAGLGTAANRVVTGCGDTIALAALNLGRVFLVYDDTFADRWRVVSHEQGAGISYTPTFSGLTIGDGSVNGEYYRNGKMVWWRAHFTFGSTSAMAASTNVSFPFTAANATYAGTTGRGEILDTGTNRYPAATIPNSTTVAQVVTASSPMVAIGTTAPMTWATGDQLNLFGVYMTP